MNTRNLSYNGGNYTCGFSGLDNIQYFLTGFNIPSLDFSQPEVYNRGARAFLNADSINFGSLNLSLMIDEDFTVYLELMDRLVYSVYDVETGNISGNHSNDMIVWVQLNNLKGNKLPFKIEFYGCKLESMGEVQLNTLSEDEIQTLDVTLKFDYFKIIRD